MHFIKNRWRKFLDTTLRANKVDGKNCTGGECSSTKAFIDICSIINLYQQGFWSLVH